jgi:hypothetical protein
MSENKEIIERIRRSFITECEQNPDLYHKNDVELIRSKDWTIERFVLVNKSEETALRALIKAMQWRKSYGVNDFNDQYFPEEIYKIGLLANFCKDKDDRQVLWQSGKYFHKSAELGQMLRQYTVYQFEKLDRQTSHQGWASVSDSTDMGLSNVELDFSYFLTDVIQNYYPRGMKYMLVIDLPWILNATSKIVMAFMNEELRNSVKFIKKRELPNYLDKESIPVHLDGKNNQKLNQTPEGVKPLDQLTHTKFTSEQIKKIYSTFKSELK